MNRIVTCVLAAAAFGAALASDDIPPPRPVDVAALVRQLGSDDFAEREGAVKRLSTLSVDEVPPELLAALKSDNPEVRDRAAKAVKALREYIALAPERAAVARLPRGERFARRGQIDLYVASTAAGGAGAKDDDDRLWAPALDVGRRLVEKGAMKGGRMPQGCPALCEDFPAFRAAFRDLRFVRTADLYAPPEGYVRRYYRAIQAAGVAEPEVLYGLVVSRGRVGASYLGQSLVLATDDVASGDDVSDSVVVCDGDVRVGGNVFNSLIIGRGNITIKGTTTKSTLIAGGTVTIAKPSEMVRRVTNDPVFQKEFDREWETIKVVADENMTRPLGYITFFELSAVGVEVKVIDKAVRVTAVADDKPFAAAGVRVGDVVTAVGGKKPDSAESLRRLLRDALALGDAAVTLRRGDRDETVKVSLPD